MLELAVLFDDPLFAIRLQIAMDGHLCMQHHIMDTNMLSISYLIVVAVRTSGIKQVGHLCHLLLRKGTSQ
jgi:hypothetical protein